MAESSVEKARRQFEEAKARLQAAEARERTVERKRDTRRKVILGGALLELAGRDGLSRYQARLPIPLNPHERS